MIDKKAYLKRMWRAGKPIREIAGALGIGQRSVQRYATKLRLGRHPNDTWRCRMTKTTRAKIIKMREDGASLTEISKAYGFSFSWISEVCRPEAKRQRRAKEALIPVVASSPPPQHRLELRERMYELQHVSLTAHLMGDPVPGRRELLERFR